MWMSYNFKYMNLPCNSLDIWYIRYSLLFQYFDSNLLPS